MYQLSDLFVMIISNEYLVPCLYIANEYEYSHQDKSIRVIHNVVSNNQHYMAMGSAHLDRHSVGALKVTFFGEIIDNPNFIILKLDTNSALIYSCMDGSVQKFILFFSFFFKRT